MKLKNLTTVILLPSSILFTAFLFLSQVAFKNQLIEQVLTIKDNSQNISVKQNKQMQGRIIHFLEALGARKTEGLYCTHGQYSCVNRGGLKGKYQFDEPLLKDLKNHRCITQKQIENLLNEPATQEKAILCAFVLYNQYLNEKINTNSYIGKIAEYSIITDFDSNFDGRVDQRKQWQGEFKITLSGLLAGVHFGGAKNVANFLKNGDIWVDANGTPVLEYIHKFSGYF